MDVPAIEATKDGWGQELPAVPEFTTFISAASIYRMTPCTEEVARAAVRQFRERPVACVAMPAPAALPCPPDDDGDDDDGECEECHADRGDDDDGDGPF